MPFPATAEFMNVRSVPSPKWAGWSDCPLQVKISQRLFLLFRQLDVHSDQHLNNVSGQIYKQKVNISAFFENSFRFRHSRVDRQRGRRPRQHGQQGRLQVRDRGHHGQARLRVLVGQCNATSCLFWCTFQLTKTSGFVTIFCWLRFWVPPCKLSCDNATKLGNRVDKM